MCVLQNENALVKERELSLELSRIRDEVGKWRWGSFDSPCTLTLTRWSTWNGSMMSSCQLPITKKKWGIKIGKSIRPHTLYLISPSLLCNSICLSLSVVVSVGRWERLQGEKAELERTFEQQLRKLKEEQEKDLQDLQERLRKEQQEEIELLQHQQSSQLEQLSSQHQQQVRHMHQPFSQFFSRQIQAPSSYLKIIWFVRWRRWVRAMRRPCWRWRPLITPHWSLYRRSMLGRSKVSLEKSRNAKPYKQLKGRGHRNFWYWLARRGWLFFYNSTAWISKGT